MNILSRHCRLCHEGISLIRRMHATHPEFLRYACVGVISNAIGYGVYLILTTMLEPKTTVSILYPTAMLIGFLGHKKWSFKHQGTGLSTFCKYLSAHAGGYLINLTMLHVLSTVMGYPHQLVQAAAVFVVAAYLFVMFKYVVFAHNKKIEPP